MRGLAITSTYNYTVQAHTATIYALRAATRQQISICPAQGFTDPMKNPIRARVGDRFAATRAIANRNADWASESACSHNANTALNPPAREFGEWGVGRQD